VFTPMKSVAATILLYVEPEGHKKVAALRPPWDSYLSQYSALRTTWNQKTTNEHSCRIIAIAHHPLFITTSERSFVVNYYKYPKRHV